MGPICEGRYITVPLCISRLPITEARGRASMEGRGMMFGSIIMEGRVMSSRRPGRRFYSDLINGKEGDMGLLYFI